MSAQGMGVLDAVKLELVWTRLISTVDEAAKAIIRNLLLDALQRGK